MGTQNRQWEARTWTRPQPKPLDFGPSPSGGPKGEPNFGIFSYSRCGPILTRIGAYENALKSQTFSCWWAFFCEVGFWFSVFFSENGNRFFLKISNRRKNAHQHKKERKKTSGVTLGTFSNDLTVNSGHVIGNEVTAHRAKKAPSSR